MRHNYFLGVDPGLVTDPTGMVLIRVTRPAVVVQEGRVLDAATGEQMIVPEGVTLAEFVAPKFAIKNVESRQGLTFSQIARESRAVMDDMGGSNFTAVVDATGLGVGAVDAIRRAGVPTIAVTLTAGSKITGSRWNWNVPVSLMFSGLFSVMSQNRIQVTDPAGKKLIEELKEIERRVSETTARETYDVASGLGHHGDLCYALGMGIVVAEKRIGRQSRSIQLNPKGHQRRPGRPRQGNTARRVIKARLEQSRLQSEATMWAQIGQDKDPNFE